MNSKNTFLVVLLFSIAAAMASANGPAPVNTAQVADGAVTTAKIADGAVTAAKTDGTLMLTDGSNASDAATVRGNLGLGTMALATATDYIATDTHATDLATKIDVNGNNADGGIYRAIATGTILAAADTITVSIAASKINTAVPKFILRIGGVEHIYPHNHAIISVTDDGADVTITLDAAVATDRNWSLLTLSDNL